MYEAITENNLDLYSNNIRECANGKQKQAFGYVWKFV